MINNQHAVCGVVFPGQGAQTVGMLLDIAKHFQEVKETFAEASAVLGYDLWQLVEHGPAAELNKTTYTQPAVLAASYAIWRIIQDRRPIQPIVLAGHSLGEYTALVCANALQFTDAILLVAARGRFMQEAVMPGQGAMAALVGLDEEIVIRICQQAVTADEVLSPANLNSIGQIVIAGHKTAIERAIVLAKACAAKMAVLLPVSVPSHCQLMQPAAEKLAQLLGVVHFNQPSIPIISNVDAVYHDSIQEIRAGLIKQLYMPVRWVETIQTFAKMGVECIIECGPGKVLTGLSKRIDENLRLMMTGDIMHLKNFLDGQDKVKSPQ